MLSHKTREQLFHCGAIQRSLDLHTMADHLHMGVIVVVVVVVVIVMPMVMDMVLRMLMVQAKHNGGVDRPLRHRQHSCSPTQLGLQLIL